MESSYESVPVFDNFDIDLLVKVLSHTAFSESTSCTRLLTLTINASSGPFFTFFIPLFYYFQGSRWPSPILVLSSGYYVLVSAFCELFLLLTPHGMTQPLDFQGSPSGIPACTVIRVACSLVLAASTGVNRLSSSQEVGEISA